MGKEALNKRPSNSSAADSNLEARIESVETENKALKKELADLTQRFSALESRLNNLGSAAAAAPAKAAAPAPAAAEEDDDDDDVDLFGSDDEEDDAEAERIKAERVAEYNKRKSA